VIAELRRVRPSDHLLVVDDGSTDDTPHVARRLGCPLLELPFNLGYGAAIQAGIKHGLRHGYAVVVTFDADGQHDPGDIAALVEAVAAGADVFAKQYDGSSIAREYGRCGIDLRQVADVDRVNGWAEILRRLGDPQAGIAPKLYIHPRCSRLIGTLPALQHDPNRPEDVLKVDVDDDTGEGGDDAADALRYMIARKAAGLRAARLVG